MTVTKKMSLNKIDIVGELALSNINSLLFMVDSLENNSLAIYVAKQLENKKICYVTLHKTADAVKELLEKKKIDTSNIVFVDGITKVIGLPANDNVKMHFVNSPGDLMGLNLIIFNLFNKGYDYLIFDSLTDLMPYSQLPKIKEFISNLINNAKRKNTKVLFYTQNSQNISSFIAEIEPLINGVINADVI